MNKTTIIVAIFCLVIAGVGGYFVGKNARSANSAQMGFQRGAGRFGGFGGQNGNRPVRGKVISADTNGITVQLPDGSSKIVLTTASTAFVKPTNASKDDVQTGDTVMVFGPQNSDGSVTAQNVQINPPQMQRPNTTPTASQ